MEHGRHQGTYGAGVLHPKCRHIVVSLSASLAEGPWRHEFSAIGSAGHLDLSVKIQDPGFCHTEPVFVKLHFPLKELTWCLGVTSVIKMSFRLLENNLAPDFKGPQIRSGGPFRE